MNKNWTTTGVSFKYMLSDYCLFAYELRLKVKRFDFRNAGSNTFDIPNEQPLQKGEMGYLLRSLPLDGNQPVIREDKGYYYYIPEKFNRYYIDLRQSFDVYLAKFSSKTRSTMRRKVKKFKVHCNGKMDWQRYQTPEEMRLFYKNARIVSEKSYQEKLLDSGLPNSATFKKKCLIWPIKVLSGDICFIVMTNRWHICIALLMTACSFTSIWAMILNISNGLWAVSFTGMHLKTCSKKDAFHTLILQKANQTTNGDIPQAVYCVVMYLFSLKI